MTAPAMNMKTEASMTETQAIACLQRAAKRRDREMILLRKRGAIGRRNGQRYLRKVIHRRDVILATAVDQFQRWGKGVGSKHGPTALEVIAVTEKLDLWKPSSEPVYVAEKERFNAKTRRYFKLGLVESIRQLLLHRVAGALTVFHPNQFGLSGGRPSAVHWLTEFLGGAELVMTTDIPDFFHRANRASMESGLPLPRRVTLAALFAIMDRAEAVKWSKNMLSVPGSLSSLPQTGIVAVSPKGRGTPSGAALSQIAADIVIREILLAVEAVPGVRADVTP